MHLQKQFFWHHVESYLNRVLLSCQQYINSNRDVPVGKIFCTESWNETSVNVLSNVNFWSPLWQKRHLFVYSIIRESFKARRTWTLSHFKIFVFYHIQCVCQIFHLSIYDIYFIFFFVIKSLLSFLALTCGIQAWST